jgi:tRNA-modifying protein YgfZ
MPEKELNLPPGFFVLSWGTVQITGPDAADFLNRMSTLDFKRWDPTLTRLGAFLTGKSGVVTLGFFQSHSEGFHFLVPANRVAPTLEHIEQFHFAEKMQTVDASAQWSIVACTHAGATLPAGLTAISWTDPWLGQVRWFRVAQSDLSLLLAHWREQGLVALDDAQLLFAHAAAGMPRVGVEIDSTVMLLEAGLERAVDRNKGCYPGQEVVERIFTYGQVNRKLLPVGVNGTWRNVLLPLKFLREDKPAAILTSVLTDPRNPSVAVGQAFIYRSHWASKEPFQSDGVEIRLL